jgi:hypothetical protein
VIYDPTLDDLYQKLVLAVEERETKHLGTIYISSILRKDLSSGKLKMKSAHASRINPGNRGRKTSPLSTTPHLSPAKANVGFSTSAKHVS